MWQLARAMTSQRHTKQQNGLLTINEIAASLPLFFYSSICHVIRNLFLFRTCIIACLPVNVFIR